MNRTFVEPLVETRFNGGPRQGAHLTPTAHKVLAAFRDLEQRVQQAAAESEHRRFLMDHLRTTPLASRGDTDRQDLSFGGNTSDL